MSRTVTYYFEVDSTGTVKGAGQAEKALEGVTEKTEKVSASTVALGGALAIAATKVASFFASMLSGANEAYARQEQAEQRLTAVVEATGQAAGYTSQELAGMAAEIQTMTRFGDEHLMESMAQLLTFRSVTGETFERAMHSATDLAEVFGSLESATMQLGKALEDPVQGVNALRRSGISFSDAQREQIKNFVEMNDLASAQAIILETVEGQVGGVAAAMAQTPTGQWEQFMNRLGDGQEKVGKLVSLMRAEMIPTLDFLLDKANATFSAMNTGIEFVQQNSQRLRPMILGIATAVGVAATAWIAYTAYVNAAALATAVATGGITLLIAGFAALVGVLAFTEDGVTGVTEIFGGFFDFMKIIFSNLPQVASDSFQLLAEIFSLPVDITFRMYEGLFKSLTGMFTTFVKSIPDLIRGNVSLAEVAGELGNDFLDGFTESFEGTFDDVNSKIENLLSNTDFSPATDRMSEGASLIAGAFVDTFSFTIEEAREEGKLSVVGDEEFFEEEEERFQMHLERLQVLLDEHQIVTGQIEAQSLAQSTARNNDYFRNAGKSYDDDANKRLQAILDKQAAEIAYTRQMMVTGSMQMRSVNDVTNAVKSAVRESIIARFRQAAADQFAWVISTLPWPINIAAATGAAALVTAAANTFLPFATGGEVPVRVSNGEYAFPPEFAGKHKNTLERMNASPAAAARFGLISGPGTGTSDSITTSYPSGTFIMNAASTKAMLSRAQGGWIGMPERGTGSGSGDNSALISAINNLSQRLERMEVKVTGEIGNDQINLANAEYERELEETRV